METGKAIALVQKLILEHGGSAPDDYSLDEPYVCADLDSLDIVKIAMKVEEVLHTEFSDAQLSEIKTIRDFANLVASVGEQCPTS